MRKADTLRKALSAALLMTILTSSGCITTPVCVTPSTTPLVNQTIVKNLGRTEGTDYTWSFLGLWMWDRPDMEAAIEEAVHSRKGNALINVTCYEKTVWFVLFSINSVVVEGDAVLLSPGPSRGKEK